MLSLDPCRERWRGDSHSFFPGEEHFEPPQRKAYFLWGLGGREGREGEREEAQISPYEVPTKAVFGAYLGPLPAPQIPNERFLLERKAMPPTAFLFG